MKRLGIIVVGDELLLGNVTDTNSGMISRALNPHGFSTTSVVTVADNATAIRKAVESSLENNDLVIMTGGLGPTKDDITKHVLTEIFGGELRENPDVTENVKRVMSLRCRTINSLTLHQAWVPTSCDVIPNEVGTAPAMLFRRDGKSLIAIPGVPFEARHIVYNEILPRVTDSDSPTSHLFLTLDGISESAVAERLDDIERDFDGRAHLAYLPQIGYLRLRVDSPCALNAEVMRDKIALRLEEHLLSLDGEPLAAILLNKARAEHLKVAVAESCTGGNIAHNITLIPGSSEVFVGGVASYSNEVKIAQLGVNPATLETHGAVSVETAREMALGALRIGANDADIAVSTTGIAGPGGGSELKPVGTVCFAVARRRDDEISVKEYRERFPGSRERVIEAATSFALRLLIRAI